MKKIKLGGVNKGYAIVDDSDYEHLNQWNWSATKDGNDRFYVTRTDWTTKKPIRVRMHRVIMAAKKGQQVDHINHDGLCNIRSNLRFCTNQENMRNRRPNKNSTSKYKGVGRQPGSVITKWRCRIRVDGRLIELGQFNNEIDAAIEYNRNAIGIFGEFANLNIIP